MSSRLKLRQTWVFRVRAFCCNSLSYVAIQAVVGGFLGGCKSMKCGRVENFAFDRDPKPLTLNCVPRASKELYRAAPSMDTSITTNKNESATNKRSTSGGGSGGSSGSRSRSRSRRGRRRTRSSCSSRRSSRSTTKSNSNRVKHKSNRNQNVLPGAGASQS